MAVTHHEKEEGITFNKFEARNPKFETNPNDRNSNKSKQKHVIVSQSFEHLIFGF
jgi:hypothetical protein